MSWFMPSSSSSGSKFCPAGVTVDSSARTAGSDSDFMSWIKDLATRCANSAKVPFSYVGDFVKLFCDKMSGFVSGVFGYIIPDSIKNTLSGITDKVGEWLGGVFTGVFENFFENAKKMMKKAGKGLIIALMGSVAFVGVCAIVMMLCRVLQWSAEKIANMLAYVVGASVDYVSWMTDWVFGLTNPTARMLYPSLGKIKEAVLAWDSGEASRHRLATAMAVAESQHSTQILEKFFDQLIDFLVSTAPESAHVYEAGPLRYIIKMHPSVSSFVTTKLEQVKANHYAGIGPLEFIAGVCALGFTGAWPELGDVRKCVETFRVFGGGLLFAKASLSFAELFLGFLPSGLMFWTRKYLYGVNTFDDQVPQAVKTARILTQQALDGAAVNSNYLARLDCTLDILDDLFPRVSPPTRRLVLDTLVNLNGVRKQLKAGAALTRHVPALIRFVSPPGVGKSTIFKDFFCDVLGEPDKYFPVPRSSKYWEGVNAVNSKGILFDEFGQRTDQIADDIGATIDIVSCTPFYPPIAGLPTPQNPVSSKGLSIHPELVVLAGNVGTIAQVKEISDMRAFERRADYIFEVSVIPRYQKGGTGVDKNELDFRKLEADKKSGVFSKDDIALQRHLLFRPHVLMANGMTVVSRTEWWNYAKVVKYTKEIIKMRQDQFARMNADQVSKVDDSSVEFGKMVAQNPSIAFSRLRFVAMGEPSSDGGSSNTFPQTSKKKRKKANGKGRLFTPSEGSRTPPDPKTAKENQQWKEMRESQEMKERENREAQRLKWHATYGDPKYFCDMVSLYNSQKMNADQIKEWQHLNIPSLLSACTSDKPNAKPDFVLGSSIFRDSVTQNQEHEPEPEAIPEHLRSDTSAEEFESLPSDEDIAQADDLPTAPPLYQDDEGAVGGPIPTQHFVPSEPVLEFGFGVPPPQPQVPKPPSPINGGFVPLFTTRESHAEVRHEQERWNNQPPLTPEIQVVTGCCGIQVEEDEDDEEEEPTDPTGATILESREPSAEESELLTAKKSRVSQNRPNVGDYYDAYRDRYGDVVFILKPDVTLVPLMPGLEQDVPLYGEDWMSKVGKMIGWILAGVGFLKLMPVVGDYLEIPATLRLKYGLIKKAIFETPEGEAYGRTDGETVHAKSAYSAPMYTTAGSNKDGSSRYLRPPPTGQFHAMGASEVQKRNKSLMDRIVRIHCAEPCCVTTKFGCVVSPSRIVTFAHNDCTDPNGSAPHGKEHKAIVVEYVVGGETFSVPAAQVIKKKCTLGTDIIEYNIPMDYLKPVSQLSFIQEMSQVSKSQLIYFKPIRGDVLELEPYSTTGSPTRVDINQGYLVAGVKVYNQVLCATFDVPSITGDCGMPLFAMTSSRQIVYVGPMVGGTLGGQWSLASIYLPEKPPIEAVAFATNELTDDENVFKRENLDQTVKSYGDSDPPVPQLYDLHDDLQQVAIDTSKKRLKVLKRLDYNLRGSGKSKYKMAITFNRALAALLPDLLNDEDGGVEKFKFSPAALDRAPDKVHPGYYKLKQYAFSEAKTPRHLEAAADAVLNILRGALRTGSSSPSVITREQAIHGIPGVERMDLTTSPGFPFILSKRRKPGKAGFVTIIDRPGKSPEVIYDQMLHDRFRDYDVARINGRAPPQTVVGHLKDEPVTIDKSKARKTRIIFCCDMVLLTELKCLTGLLMADVARTWSIHKMLIGCDLHSRDMELLIDGLSWEPTNPYEDETCGTMRAACGDFSSFDLKMAPEVLEAAWDIIGQLGQEFVHGWDGFWFDCLKKALINASFIVDDVELGMVGFNASGNYLTTFINSIVNKVYFFAWMIEKGYNPLVDLKHYAGGDDNIWSVRPALRSELNPRSFSNWCGAHGLTYTPAEKGTEWTDDNEWLPVDQWVIYGVTPQPVLIETSYPIDLDSAEEAEINQEAHRVAWVGRVRAVSLMRILQYRKRTTDVAEWASAVLEMLSWWPREVQESVKNLLVMGYKVIAPRASMIASMHSFRVSENVALYRNPGRPVVDGTLARNLEWVTMGDLQVDVMPTMEAEAGGEQSRVITPAVAETIQNAVTMLPIVNLPAATQVGAGQSGGAYATVATGDLAVSQVPTCPFNLSVHSFTAPPVDQRAGLGSWQLRKRVAVASNTTSALDILCPFELLSFGDVGATVRAQRMPFEAFAYSRGTVEVGIDVAGQGLNVGGFIGVKLPVPYTTSGTPLQVESFPDAIWMRLSRTHRYIFTMEFEHDKTAFSNVAGMDLAETDENNWRLLVLRVAASPADQPSVNFSVYSRFTDFTFAIPRLVPNSIVVQELKAMLRRALYDKKRDLATVERRWKNFTVDDANEMLGYAKTCPPELLRQFKVTQSFMSRQIIDTARLMRHPYVSRFEKAAETRRPRTDYVAMGASHSTNVNNTSVTQVVGGSAEGLSGNTIDQATDQVGANVDAAMEGPALPMHHPQRSGGGVPMILTAGQMTNVQGGNYTHSMNHTGVAMVANERVFIHDDETDLHSIMKRELRVASGDIDLTTSVSGTSLYSREMTLSNQSIYPDIYADYFSGLAMKWRGDFFITIRTFGNDFQKFSVIVYAGYGMEEAPIFDTIDRVPNVQAILSGDQPAVRVRIPFNSVFPTLNVRQETSNDLLDPILDTSLGFMGVYLNSPLVTTDAYPKCPYIITVSFEGNLFHLNPNSQQAFTAVRTFSAVVKKKTEWVAMGVEAEISSKKEELLLNSKMSATGGNVMPITDMTILPRTHTLSNGAVLRTHRKNFEGQPIPSLNTLYRRFTPYLERPIVHVLEDLDDGRKRTVFVYPIDYAVLLQPVVAPDYVGSNCFQAVKGGLQFQIFSNGTDYSVVWHPGRQAQWPTPASGETREQAWFRISPSMQHALSLVRRGTMTQTTSTKTQTWSFESLPPYAHKSFGAYQRSRFGHLSIQVDWVDHRLYLDATRPGIYGTLIITMDGETPQAPDVFWAGARDFQFGRWVGRTPAYRTVMRVEAGAGDDTTEPSGTAPIFANVRTNQPSTSA